MDYTKTCKNIIAKIIVDLNKEGKNIKEGSNVKGILAQAFETNAQDHAFIKTLCLQAQAFNLSSSGTMEHTHLPLSKIGAIAREYLDPDEADSLQRHYKKYAQDSGLDQPTLPLSDTEIVMAISTSPNDFMNIDHNEVA